MKGGGLQAQAGDVPVLRREVASPWGIREGSCNPVYLENLREKSCLICSAKLLFSFLVLYGSVHCTVRGG